MDTCITTRGKKQEINANRYLREQHVQSDNVNLTSLPYELWSTFRAIHIQPIQQQPLVYICATVTQKTKIQRLWCAARRTLFRCSTGRVHGEIDKEQSRPSRVGHRRWKLLKLGEGSWFAIPYRTILEAPRDLHRSSRSAFETGSNKGWAMLMKNTRTDGQKKKTFDRQRPKLESLGIFNLSLIHI